MISPAKLATTSNPLRRLRSREPSPASDGILVSLAINLVRKMDCPMSQATSPHPLVAVLKSRSSELAAKAEHLIRESAENPAVHDLDLLKRYASYLEPHVDG